MDTALRWDVYCRVIDNHGDLGVCWRLARHLAARGHRLRLFVDDASALTWMAPRGAPRIDIVDWARAASGATDTDPADVVIEAFGCDLPVPVVEAMRGRERPPVWINLEYLSAEPYVERSHGLPSPQSGAGEGLIKWFFFPGFTDRTAGLLRAPDEPGIAADAHAPQVARLLHRLDHERVVTVFTYGDARLEPLLEALDTSPTLIAAAQGPSQARLKALFDGDGHRGRHLRLRPLPWLEQPAFDALLDAGDLNVVRGEDSLVRALWTGRPFLWNLYPQGDGARAAKLEAFLDRMLAGAPPDLARVLRSTFRSLNGLGPGCGVPIDEALLLRWRAAIGPWLQSLRTQPSLAASLEAFVARHRLV